MAIAERGKTTMSDDTSPAQRPATSRRWELLPFVAISIGLFAALCSSGCNSYPLLKPEDCEVVNGTIEYVWTDGGGVVVFVDKGQRLILTSTGLAHPTTPPNGIKKENMGMCQVAPLHEVEWDVR